MSTQLTVNKPHVFKAEFDRNLQQNNPGSSPAFLQVPKEILEKIVNHMAVGERVWRVTSLIQVFSSICAWTHLMTHRLNFKKFIPKWVKDPTNTNVSNLVDYNGNIVTTVTRCSRNFFM